MNEDRLFADFRTLDAPVDADPAFAERLFESLAADLGFREQPGPTRPGLRLRRAFGLERPPRRRAALRLAYLFAILGLLLALAIGAAIVAGRLTPQLSTDDIVQRSQQLSQNPPAFDMVVLPVGGLQVRYRYDGSGSLREDYPDGGALPPGSYQILTTATQNAIYNAAEGSWSVNDLPVSLPPDFLAPFRWITDPIFPGQEAPTPRPCASGWQRSEDGTVAGRPAFHVTCGELGFWIDQATFLLTGSDPTEVPSSMGAKATSVSIGTALDPSLFTLTPPPGSYDAAHPPPSTVLKVGEIAPNWTAPTASGETLDTRSLHGKAAAILFWPTCGDCLGQSLDAFGATARTHPGVGFVAVSWPGENPVAKQQYLAEAGEGFTEVDGNDEIAATWGIQESPALVLLDEDGRVQALTGGGPISAADMEAMVSALEAGQPIPTPSPTPSPTPVPEPTVLTSPPPSGAKASTTLALGDPLPGIDGVLEDKSGDFSSSTLTGKPAVILVFSGA